MSEVLARFSKMVATLRQLDVAQVKPESRLAEDLGADSIDIVELMLDAEREFGIDIEKRDAQALRTVGEVAQFIEARMVAPTTKKVEASEDSL